MSPVPFPADMNASSARDWTVDQPRTPRDIPIQHRTTEQYLESMCVLLEELVVTQRHLLARLRLISRRCDRFKSESTKGTSK